MRASTASRFRTGSDMLLYIIVILLSMLAIFLCNWLLAAPTMVYGAGWLAAAVVCGTVEVILLDGLLAFLIRRLPNDWFQRGRAVFSVSRRECALYCRMGIRRWKDRIPELGCFTSFHKDRVYHPQDNQYVARFIMECNYGVLIHLVGALAGGAIALLLPSVYALSVCLPIALVNAVLNLLPLFVLRYNTPKLETLYQLNERHAAKKSLAR